MTAQRHIDYLEHMLQAANDARMFVEGLEQCEFVADKRTQQAVILNLLIIGEAASKLLQSHGDFLAQHPELPWASVVRRTWRHIQRSSGRPDARRASDGRVAPW